MLGHQLLRHFQHFQQRGYEHNYANNQTSQTVTASFNVAAPSGLQVTGSTGVPDVYYSATYATTMGFVDLLNYGLQVRASATNPQGAPGGSFSWVQLLIAEKDTIREGGPYAGTGVVGCIPVFFAADPSPELDTQYPAATGSSFSDAPNINGLGPRYVGDVAGEQQHSMSFTTYLMWNPNLSGSIPVALGSLSWQWTCDAANTLTTQSNRTTWIRACAAPQTPGTVQFSPSASYPQWQYLASNGQTPQSCQYQ